MPNTSRIPFYNREKNDELLLLLSTFFPHIINVVYELINTPLKS